MLGRICSVRSAALYAATYTFGPAGAGGNQAEVKLADSLGDSAWVCLPHAEEMLVTVPAAFIASHNDRGIAAFRAGH